MSPWPVSVKWQNDVQWISAGHSAEMRLKGRVTEQELGFMETSGCPFNLSFQRILQVITSERKLKRLGVPPTNSPWAMCPHGAGHNCILVLSLLWLVTLKP
jgi:hypothetical protein